MVRRLEPLLSLGVCAVTLTVLSATNAFAPAAPRTERFPRDLVLRTPPTAARVPLEQPDPQLAYLLDRANATWRAAFAAMGRPYSPARLRIIAASDAGGRCVPPHLAVYCPADRTVVVSRAAADEVVRNLGVFGAHDRFATMIGHELGHHVDALRYAPWHDRVRAERRATCLGGAFLRALFAGQPPPPQRFGSDELHGSAEGQLSALVVGEAAGRPADCDGALG